MPDENRFAGLGDAVDDDLAPDEAAATVDDDPADGDEGEESGGPAFPFEDTSQESFYVRPETIDDLDDARFEVEATLRRDHGVRDLTGREFQDAVLRVAVEHCEEVLETVVDERDGD